MEVPTVISGEVEIETKVHPLVTTCAPPVVPRGETRDQDVDRCRVLRAPWCLDVPETFDLSRSVRSPESEEHKP